MGGRIAVLVRERQGEALRVAAGLTLCDARVEVYVLDRPLAETAENAENLGLLAGLGVAVGTNSRSDPRLAYHSTAEIARRILACDHILPY
jgi:hypothetical protein